MLFLRLAYLAVAPCASALGVGASVDADRNASEFNRTVSNDLFFELEELSRLTAISYCVGGTGIHKPFQCLSRCSDFPKLQLVETFHTGLLDAQACGYIALDHAPARPRIVVAFTGTQSVSDVFYDMLTAPAAYLPYPVDDARCVDCAVHAGFMLAWNATRSLILPTLVDLVEYYPRHELVLTGHSLGGALAGLAALEFESRGWQPRVTTFGEPRFGNMALAAYVDEVFPWNVTEVEARYRRVTHAGDPVPLLPYAAWGWAAHGGEVFITKPDLPPAVGDLQRCAGGADPKCIAGAEEPHPGWTPHVPERWRLWELLFAHREYFWRLGLCFEPQWGGYPRPDDPSDGSSLEL